MIDTFVDIYSKKAIFRHFLDEDVYTINVDIDVLGHKTFIKSKNSKIDAIIELDTDFPYRLDEIKLLVNRGQVHINKTLIYSE